MELPQLTDTIECSCGKCVAACHRKPGWFLPEEIKPAADLMGLSEKEFFDKYLGVDYYVGESEQLFVLTPATNNTQPGKEYPLDPEGRCVFLTDDEKCAIHAAKPYECKYYDHRYNESVVDEARDQHHAVAEAWIPHKDKIVELLGREPSVETNIFEMLDFLMNIITRGQNADRSER